MVFEREHDPRLGRHGHQGLERPEHAVQAALQWEQDVTRQIGALMDLAVKQSDYMSQSFLQWFIDEQLEEVVKMDTLLSVIRQSGEKNLLMVEAYLVHIEKSH